MSSYDISFCSNRECSRKDCHRHYDKAQEAFRKGALRLTFSSWVEEGCKNYWKDE